MANRTVPSDHELVSLAREFTLERDFFNLGVKLNFLIAVLNTFLKWCKDNVYRASLVTLQQWRDQQLPGTDVRSQLHTIFQQLGYHKAADMLVTDDDDFDKRNLLWKVEVYTLSESSASITKNMDFQSDLADEVSMVSSATSQSDYCMSVRKDSKFDGSGSEKPSESSNTGSTDYLDQLNVNRTPDPGRVAGWLNEAEAVMQLMIGAPGADRLPDPSESRSTGLTDYLNQLNVDRTPDPSVDGGVAGWVNTTGAGMQPRIGAPGADRLSDIRPSIGHLETLRLEDYQVELAEPALQGYNTCVVAPTGSGKTYVAVAVAQEVLRKSPGKKVIFVVNQVPLVHQQSTVFKKYIKDVAYICGDHGQPQITRLPLDQVLKKNDVVVLRAQILVDALTKGQVSFNQIGIIVFDECHETKKESQYNAIMAKYMEQKLKNKNPLPQILGMTASLGVGNARSDKNAIQYMLKMCANMDVVKLSTVKKHKESLEKVVNKPEEGLHVVTSRTEDSFAEEIQDLMYQVFKYINSSTGSAVLNTTVEKLSSLRSSNHSRENFSHVLCKLKKEIAENTQSKDLQLGLMTCAQYLKEYSSALAIHETARTKDALQCLQEFIKEKSSKAVTTNTEKILIRTFQEKQQELERISMSPKSPNNPALDELQNLIERDIVTCRTQENNGPFRAILFTQTIASTWALQKWVMETDSLKDLHPEVLVGCRNPGMNLRHQTDVLDNFRNGVHKLLIATSVIQQGIDIPACNFVYRYNYITDAVARIQARGRTRKPGGRFDLVVHDYRGLDGKDKLSKEQEQIMQQATDAVSSLSIEQMILGTAEYQQHRNVQIFNQQRPKPFDQCNHSYHCKHCDALVCHSADIRIVPGGHHVVIHRQIFSKIRIVASRGVGQDPGHWSSVEHAKKEIRCADERCDTKLGSILKCNNRMLLAFSIKSLRLRSEASKTKTNKSWGSLPFIFQKVPVTEASFGFNDIPSTVA